MHSFRYLNLNFSYRNEVGTALVGDGFGDQSLPAPRRAVEQRAFGGLHAELEELLGVLDRVGHRLVQLLLHLT